MIELLHAFSMAELNTQNNFDIPLDDGQIKKKIDRLLKELHTKVQQWISAIAKDSTILRLHSA